jgi:beta-glucosidase-like glycosyl hydrolase
MEMRMVHYRTWVKLLSPQKQSISRVGTLDQCVFQISGIGHRAPPPPPLRIAYGRGGKDAYRADISEATLFNVYLRPWKDYAAKAGGRGIMVRCATRRLQPQTRGHRLCCRVLFLCDAWCSHQETNGIPNHQSARLLTDVWRGMFGANASFIASDFGDIANLINFGLVVSLEGAGVAALGAGLDQDLGSAAFPSLINVTNLNMADVDRAGEANEFSSSPPQPEL